MVNRCGRSMPCVSGTKFIQALTALVLMIVAAPSSVWAFPFDWNAEFVNFREAPTVGQMSLENLRTEIIVRFFPQRPIRVGIYASSYLRIDPDFELPITIDATANYDDAVHPLSADGSGVIGTLEMHSQTVEVFGPFPGSRRALISAPTLPRVDSAIDKGLHSTRNRSPN